MFERDRPLFRQFIPVLKRINYAGWQAIPDANASDAAAGNAHPRTSLMLERFGSVAEGDLFWTLRRAEPLLQPAASAAATAASLVSPGAHPMGPGPEPPSPLRPVRLTLHTAQLGIEPRARGYLVTEIAHPGSAAIAPVVVTAAATADVHLPDLPHNTTFVLHLKV